MTARFNDSYLPKSVAAFGGTMIVFIIPRRDDGV